MYLDFRALDEMVKKKLICCNRLTAIPKKIPNLEAVPFHGFNPAKTHLNDAKTSVPNCKFLW